jgi:hypothetical protein
MRKSFSGSKNSRTFMKLNKNQVCIICDSDESVPELGTGFLFMKKDWIVTAAHVVMEYGLPRKNLYAEFVPNIQEKVFVNLKVLAIHEECDVAVLQITNTDNPCTKPLYPGHEELSSSKGIIYCGFESSDGNLRVEITEQFSRDSRYRNHEEVILEFPSTNVTGGYSGGPIFGDGGVILGLMINQFSNEEEPEKKFARAISINTVMDAIEIQLNKNVMKFQNQNTDDEI